MAELVEILASGLLRAAASALDLADPPTYYDFVGDGPGTGMPNTCIVHVTGDGGCPPVQVVCNSNVATYNVDNCAPNTENTWTDPTIGDFKLTWGDNTNTAPFVGAPNLFFQYLVGDDPSLSSDSEFELWQCDRGQRSTAGEFDGTACNSDDPIKVKLCATYQEDNYSTETYFVAVSTPGNSYACDASSKAKKSVDVEKENETGEAKRSLPFEA